MHPVLVREERLSTVVGVDGDINTGEALFVTKHLPIGAKNSS